MLNYDCLDLNGCLSKMICLMCISHFNRVQQCLLPLRFLRPTRPQRVVDSDAAVVPPAEAVAVVEAVVVPRRRRSGSPAPSLVAS